MALQKKAMDNRSDNASKHSLPAICAVVTRHDEDATWSIRVIVEYFCSTISTYIEGQRQVE